MTHLSASGAAAAVRTARPQLVGTAGSAKIIRHPNALWQADRNRSYGTREVIYREGDAVSQMMEIRSGVVKLQRLLPSGRARIVRLCGEGDLLGVEGLLDQPCRHTAIAVGDTVVACTRIGKLWRLEQDHPERVCRILGIAIDQLARVDRWVIDFSTGGIRARVARLIDYLATFLHARESGRIRLLSVSDMADMLGVSAESVSRVVAEFKRSGILYRRAGFPPAEYAIDYAALQREAEE